MINGNATFFIKEKRFRAATQERKIELEYWLVRHTWYDIYPPYLDARTQKEEDEEIGRREGRLVRSGLVR